VDVIHVDVQRYLFVVVVELLGEPDSLFVHTKRFLSVASILQILPEQAAQMNYVGHIAEHELYVFQRTLVSSHEHLMILQVTVAAKQNFIAS